MSRKTYCMAEMKFVDVTALPDASLSTSYNQSIGDLSLFGTETSYAEYGTLELNQFVLDGSKEIMAEQPDDIAFISKSKSQDDCKFSTSPQLFIKFTEPHTSSGLTLYFGTDYPDEIFINWYKDEETVGKRFYPNKEIMYCENSVENYNEIVIEFRATRFPGMHARLQYIIYGRILQWKDTLVKSAKIREETDITAATLPINTAEIVIIDAENDFDIGNENGAWKFVQKTQELSLKEYVNDDYVEMGMFFVDSMSFRNNEATFKTISRIGLMDGYQYGSERMIKKEKAGKILEEIFAKADVDKYSISSEVADIELSGYLPKQSCRDALKMVCFACGAVADDSRSDTVSVYKIEKIVTSNIGIDRKFYGDSNIELEDSVSGVKIEYNNYVLDTEVKEIYKDELPVGETKVEFSEPYEPESITVSCGTIEKATTDYVIVNMTEAKECVISGAKYNANTLCFTLDKAPEAGNPECIKKFGQSTVCNMGQLSVNANELLQYYSLRKKVEMRYLLEGEKAATWANIEDYLGNTVVAVIESQEIDLTGGFVAKAVCRGYTETKVAEELNYIGEFYLGERGLI